MVVVAIIAILASLLLPSLISARDRAYLSTCASNLKQIGVGMAQYTGDSVCMPPGVASTPYAAARGVNNTWAYGLSSIMTYPSSANNQFGLGFLLPYIYSGYGGGATCYTDSRMPRPSVFLCPAAVRTGAYSTWGKRWGLGNAWGGGTYTYVDPYYGAFNPARDGRAETWRRINYPVAIGHSVLDNFNGSLSYGAHGQDPAVKGFLSSEKFNVSWIDGHVTTKRPARSIIGSGYEDVLTFFRLLK